MKLKQLQTERIDAIKEAYRQAWEKSPEGKEEAEYFRSGNHVVVSN